MLEAQDEKFGNLISMLSRLADRFEKHPELLKLFVNEKTLRIFLSSLAVLNKNLGSEIVAILIKVLTHSSRIPTELLDSCSEKVWPDI